MPALTYRRARRPDLDGLVALEALFPGDRVSRRSFARLLRAASAEIWVCSREVCLLGNAVVLYRAHSRSARLYSLVVDPTVRGQGIATALLAAVESAAAHRGCTQLHLEVRRNNAAALALYTKRSYRVVRSIADYYEDGQAALRLEHSLAATAPTMAA